MGKHLIKICIF